VTATATAVPGEIVGSRSTRVELVPTSVVTAPVEEDVGAAVLAEVEDVELASEEDVELLAVLLVGVLFGVVEADVFAELVDAAVVVGAAEVVGDGPLVLGLVAPVVELPGLGADTAGRSSSDVEATTIVGSSSATSTGSDSDSLVRGGLVEASVRAVEPPEIVAATLSVDVGAGASGTLMEAGALVGRTVKSDAGLRMVEETSATPPLRPLCGTISHSSPTASTTPTVPVAIERPLPTISGGSVRSQVSAPCSEGWRQVRSCAGRGARGYSGSSSHSPRSTKGLA
jgi:hypothetical protein